MSSKLPIPQIQVIECTDESDSTSSDSEDHGDAESSESDKDVNFNNSNKLKRKAIQQRNPGYLEVRSKNRKTISKERRRVYSPPPPPCNNSPHSDTDSSAWETENEEKKKNKKTVGKKSSVNKHKEDPFNIFNFEYVNLFNKVIMDYQTRHLIDNTSNTSQPRKRGNRNNNKEIIKSKRHGGDLHGVSAPPLLLHIEDHDVLGIKNIEQILNAPDLTIEQKYRSLNVEDDPWADDNDTGTCWQWLCYKCSRIRSAQWPALFYR